MPDCIVHFGMPKTGSSSIQHALAHGLTDENFSYIRVNKVANQGRVVVSAFSKNLSTLNPYMYRNMSDQELVELRDLNLRLLRSWFSEKSCKNFILSGESISKMNKDALIDFREFISGLVENFYFVGYVRPPKSFMESVFQQKMKVGFVDFDIDKLFPPYSNFEKFYEIFGADKVQLWKFDPTNFPGGDVVMDFCQKLSINFDLSNSVRVNESMSLSALKLLYCYRKFYPEVGSSRLEMRQNSLMVKTLATLPGEKIRFHSSLVKPVIENHQAEIAWTEKKINASLTEILTKDDEIAIRNEADLLAPDDASTKWLATQLGPRYEELWQAKMSIQQVAKWMDHFRQKISVDEKKISKSEKQSARTNLVCAPSASIQPQGWMISKEKSLTDFPYANSIQDALKAEEDVIFVQKNIQKRRKKYLNDLSGVDYILVLQDSQLIPHRSLSEKETGPMIPVTLPPRISWSMHAHLLLTQHNELVCDSFFKNRAVHPSLIWQGERGWLCPVVIDGEIIKEPCFFLDLIPGHFGHALLELTARLWPLAAYPELDFEKYIFVGFPQNGLGANPDKWPIWLKQLIAALGVPIERIRLVNNPLVCKKLVIPERITPLGDSAGLVFNQLIQLAGDRLLMLSSKTQEFGARIFLSRSHLDITEANQKRSLGPEGDRNLDQLFANLGFTIVHPQELSLSDQVAAVRGAKFIAGCVGSQLHLIAFCKQKKLNVLRITPSFFAPPTDATILRPIGASFHDYVIQHDLVGDLTGNISPWSMSDSEMADLCQFVQKWSSESIDGFQ